MPLGHLRSANFAAQHFAALHLHGPISVAAEAPTPGAGVPFVRRPRLRELPPQPQPRTVDVTLSGIGEAFGRIRLEAFSLTPSLLAKAGGASQGLISADAARATSLERLLREDDEMEML